MSVSRASLLAILVLLLGPRVGAAQSMELIDNQIANLTTELERATVARERVRAEIEGLLTERAAAQRRLRARVNALTRARRSGLLPLAEGFDALVRHRSRLQRLERMVAHDSAALRMLESRVAALRDEGARLAGEAERSEAELASLRARRAELEQASIVRWTDGQQADWGGFPRPGFSALRGQLAMPVAGHAQFRDAEREGGAGVEITAAPGTAVRAVAAGRVAYAARHPSYGWLVIVDQGEGYYTVYGGLGAVTVSVGTLVEPDATLGSTGEQPLFFQVRRGTLPLTAREWLGI